MVVGGKTKDGIFKAYIPDFLYKPPFGMPRRVNTVALKELSKNPYVFSVIKTLCDEATSMEWEIVVKEEFQEEPDADADNKAPNYDDKIKEITKFFRNPNGNAESFNHLLRQVVTDLCEVDSGVFVKVFNTEGKFQQLFARDGSLFLKNPDIYGYMGNRRDFVAPLPDGFTGVAVDVGGTPTVTQQQIMKQYSLLYKEDAAYFQYGWTAGSMPVPFGKREIIYMMQNPRADSIYGRSPVEVLEETIMNLIYGIDFNLDFYTNNNMPEGVIQLLGANTEQIKQFRENWDNEFKFTDQFGKKRKKFYKVPLSSTEVKFTPFQLTAKEMEVITQQQWFTKILWMSFGVNADEMGFTEDSNKSDGENQIKTFKRKAIRPLLDVISYHINTQLMPEFFTEDANVPDSGDVPLKFSFDFYDVEEDKRKHDLLAQEILMGVKTPLMVAKELDINIEELEAELKKAEEKEDERFDKEMAMRGGAAPGNPSPKKEDNPKKKPEEKAANPLSSINSHIDNIENDIISVIGGLSEREINEARSR